jgi:hypothetical protein
VRDILVVLMTAGFFAFCVAYIRLCDRIIGADPDPSPESFLETGPESVPGVPSPAAGPVRPRDEVTA